MDRRQIVSGFRELKDRLGLDFELKEKQIDIMYAVLNGKNCRGILGTGFGKSLTYVMPTLLLNLFQPQGCRVSVVISPLRSLMLDQMEHLKSIGVSAVILQGSNVTEETLTDIMIGNYSIIFASPEAINAPHWSRLMRSKQFRQRVALVAIDEAHCVITWGKSFRPDYQSITWLGTVMTSAPLLFLTATCTEKMKAEIVRAFCVEEVVVVAAVPNRKNIFLDYKSTTAMRMEEELKFYIDELRQKGKQARKCIIYTKVNQAGEIFEEMLTQLREIAFLSDGQRVVDIYVAKSSDKAKEYIQQVFPSPYSHIRCLIASIAFGMGVDIPDVDLIIHWGVSSSILNYWQEVGRCGRDGRVGKALLIAYPRSLADRRVTDESMRDLHKAVKKDGKCMRVEVLKALYLECMGRAEIESLSQRPKCSCFLTDCTCDSCMCCVNCKRRCGCQTVSPVQPLNALP